MNNICPICNIREKKLVKNCKNIYLKTCGAKNCLLKSKQQTNLKKYGHISNLHGELEKSKIISTLKKKYGVENVSQIPEIKEKKRMTCKKHFGVDWPMQSQEILLKSKNTLMKMYGVNNISKVPSVIEKLRNHWFNIDPLLGISKYQLADFKRKEYYLEKYGVPYYYQTDEFKKKYKKKMIEKHGVDNYSKTQEFEQFLISTGRKMTNELLNEYENYYRKVVNYTSRSFTKYKKDLCKLYSRSKNYHLDHVYSISEGFKKKIDPRIIGSICNLQILPAFVNLKKRGECWIDFDKLIEIHNKLSNEDKFILH